jgi:uncharacterized protein YqhQ
MPKSKDLRLPSYGGQALIEGVMMRGKHVAVMAMRDPEGEIILEQEDLGEVYRDKLSKIPFLRGLVILWDALVLGTKAITTSANVQTGEDEQIEGVWLYATIFFSIAMSVGLFFLLPAGAGQLFQDVLGINPYWSNVLEGLVRLLILVGYIWLVALWDDVARVFAYHGAEHKTINAFEDRADLTPENVAAYSVQHPRCGTAFMLTVVLLSIIFFTLLGPMGLWLRFATRLLLIPVLASLSYEYLRWTADHMHLRWVQWLVVPNLALQRLTTREPSLDMLEVSLTAFNAMLEAERAHETAVVGAGAVEATSSSSAQ